MRCLIIQKGVVVNIAEVTPEVAAATGWPEAGIAQIGWKWIDGAAVPPERDIEAEWADVRRVRNILLESTVDRINPIRWDAMGSGERAAWTAYRQALLDLPASAEDPRAIVYPLLPTADTAAPEPAAPAAEAAEVLQEEAEPEAPLPVVIEPPAAEQPAAEKPAAEKPVAEAPKPRRRRAHHDDGTFKADDPATPENEAFSE